MSKTLEELGMTEEELNEGIAKRIKDMFGDNLIDALENVYRNKDHKDFRMAESAYHDIVYLFTKAHIDVILDALRLYGALR